MREKFYKKEKDEMESDDEEVNLRIRNKRTFKYKYKVNMNILAGIFKDEFVNVLLCSEAEESIKKYEEMIEKMKKYVVPIKPGRNYPRRKMHSMNKYRSNLRRNI